MNINDLTLGQIKELQAGFGKRKKTVIDDGSIRICVLQRGWVVVGRYSQNGQECKLTDANVIRTWGTSKGLGEIASNGPIAGKTILDACPDVVFHELVGVFQMMCEKSKWQDKLR